MGIVTPTNKEVLDFKGLHLYHFGVSNCAMRARITLEEKGLPWESHYVDLFKGEQITPEYFGINPNGVVPTLVHDGVVIIESDDIIDYLDKNFPEPPLRPTDPDALELMYHWLKLSTGIHVKGIKTFFYGTLIQGKMAQPDEQRELYEKLQTNKELLAFHKKSNEEGFSFDDIVEAKSIIDKCFSEADELLKGHEWMIGDQFSLADIAWIPLYFDLKKSVDYPFDSFPNVQAWAERVSKKPSFKAGVIDWWTDF